MDLKASLLEKCRKITRPHLITKYPMAEHKPRKKLSTTPPDKKTQNHFVEKKGMYIPACWNQLRCRKLGGRGTQKLAAKSLLKIGKWNKSKELEWMLT